MKTASFLYALMETLNEKVLLKIKELDEQKTDCGKAC